MILTLGIYRAIIGMYRRKMKYTSTELFIMLNYTSSLRYSATGKKRKTKSLKKARKYTRSFEPKQEPRNDYIYSRLEETKKYPSVELGSPSVCSAPEKKVYSGTLVKGISTMHKSNAVPIIDAEEAKEHARMRR